MTEQVMRQVRLEKVILNMGLGHETDRLEKAQALMARLAEATPTRTQSKGTSREFALRKGQDVGVKVTLRGEAANAFLHKAFWALQNKIHRYSFDKQGNLSFGVREHTDFQGERYDPNVGLFGMDVCVTLTRPGRRVALRRMRAARISKGHRVTRDEAVQFMTDTFGVEVIA